MRKSRNEIDGTSIGHAWPKIQHTRFLTGPPCEYLEQRTIFEEAFGDELPMHETRKLRLAAVWRNHYLVGARIKGADRCLDIG